MYQQYKIFEDIFVQLTYLVCLFSCCLYCTVHIYHQLHNTVHVYTLSTVPVVHVYSRAVTGIRIPTD